MSEISWERQKGESAQAFEAFTIYRDMGADRSLRAVAQKLAKSIPLIKRWSGAHHWVERCRAWDNHLQHEAKKAAVAKVRQMNRRHIKLSKQIQDTAQKALQDLGTGMVTPKNFASVIKLAVDLERQSTEAELAAVTADADKAEAQDSGPSALAEAITEAWRRRTGGGSEAE